MGGYGNGSQNNFRYHWSTSLNSSHLAASYLRLYFQTVFWLVCSLVSAFCILVSCNIWQSLFMYLCAGFNVIIRVRQIWGSFTKWKEDINSRLKGLRVRTKNQRTWISNQKCVIKNDKRLNICYNLERLNWRLCFSSWSHVCGQPCFSTSCNLSPAQAKF